MKIDFFRTEIDALGGAKFLREVTLRPQAGGPPRGSVRRIKRLKMNTKEKKIHNILWYGIKQAPKGFETANIIPKM